MILSRAARIDFLRRFPLFRRQSGRPCAIDAERETDYNLIVKD